MAHQFNNNPYSLQYRVSSSKYRNVTPVLFLEALIQKELEGTKFPSTPYFRCDMPSPEGTPKKNHNDRRDNRKRRRPESQQNLLSSNPDHSNLQCTLDALRRALSELSNESGANQTVILHKVRHALHFDSFHHALFIKLCIFLQPLVRNFRIGDLITYQA